MTEQEWLSGEDPARMLGLFFAPNVLTAPKPSDRKLRLLAAACCRAVGWSGEVIDAGERWAETGVPPDELPPNIKFGGQTWLYYPGAADAAREWATRSSVPTRATRAAILRDIIGNPFRPVTLPTRREVIGVVADGDNSGGDFYPPGSVITRVLPCPWRTPQVMDLAAAAYEHRIDGALDPFRLALLADALEEAGCTQKCITRYSDDSQWWCQDGAWNDGECSRCGGVGYVTHPVIEHLRSPGPHYRGCWAVDLILGKE